MLARAAIIAMASLMTLAPVVDAQSRPLIKNDAEIFHRMLVVAVANEIREQCPTIDARKIAATFYVFGVLSYARSKGFSMDEINAYKKDPGEQAKLRRAGYAYLDSHGVNRKKPASFCTLGKTEIAAGSEIGKLLKSRQ